jgi:hypothetical protein
MLTNPRETSVVVKAIYEVPKTRPAVRRGLVASAAHVDESENTALKRRDNWRATAWEIHPVTDMTVLD